MLDAKPRIELAVIGHRQSEVDAQAPGEALAKGLSPLASAGIDKSNVRYITTVLCTERSLRNRLCIAIHNRCLLPSSAAPKVSGFSTFTFGLFLGVWDSAFLDGKCNRLFWFLLFEKRLCIAPAPPPCSRHYASAFMLPDAHFDARNIESSLQSPLLTLYAHRLLIFRAGMEEVSTVLELTSTLLFG